MVKNGKISYGKQNYLCKGCHRQFIADHNLTYKGCLSIIY
ncbi:IS1/IS1595 family N-terminal zinc-binding domain-containing protein [Capnocytophaga canis]